MEPKNILIALLLVIGVVFHAFWYLTERRRRHPQQGTLKPTGTALGIAFVANFFDTLGIGSFATTTSMSKLWKVMPDEKIPGTLNVGYVMATVVQAVIFMTIIEVDFITLVSIIGAAIVGAFLGAGVVRVSTDAGADGQGIALLVASALMGLSISGQGPPRVSARFVRSHLGMQGCSMCRALMCSARFFRPGMI